MAILNAIWCALIKVINALTDHVLETVTDALAWIISLLPSLPIGNKPLEWGVFGDAIGYFIPIGTMVQHFVLMLALMVVWYSVQHIMRLIRMIK